MPIRKNVVILVVVSFLAAALIFGSSSSRFVQAVPVWGPAGQKKCTSDFFSRTCCWLDTDTDAIKKFCETCIDQGDGTYADCKTTEGPVSFTPKQPPIIAPPSVGPTQPSSGNNMGGVSNGQTGLPGRLGNALPPSSSPPLNAVPPPSALPSPTKQQTLTTTCPDGSLPDANGNCPTTTANQQSGSTSNNNNNNPQQGHHHKGSNNQPTQTGGTGGQELTATKKHKGSKTDQGTTTVQPSS